MSVVAVHGGAGQMTPERLGAERVALVRAGLERALQAAVSILGDGGSALDAAVAAVVVLEDDEQFNAGRGAALTSEGVAELDAAVADGTDRRFGAVGAVTTVRNPVALARRVLEDGRHVLVVGPQADALAGEWGLATEPPAYFVTERARTALSSAAAGSGGTVGAVALDADGRLAAATSTGGMSGQRPGRVGDTPINGAGTWADDRTCAVSATGYGEMFVRSAFAASVHSRMLLSGSSLADACDAGLEDVRVLGGFGGCVAVDRHGNVALPFNSAGMHRGWCRVGGPLYVGTAPGDVPPG